jgi:hypothetical protein
MKLQSSGERIRDKHIQDSSYTLVIIHSNMASAVEGTVIRIVNYVVNIMLGRINLLQPFNLGLIFKKVGWHEPI